MSSKASCCYKKGRNRTAPWTAIHAKVKELNEHILPPGVQVVPFLDRSDLVHYTTHTVLHNLGEGVLAGLHHSVFLSRKCSRRLDRRDDHTLLPAVRFHLPGPEQDSRQSCFPWALWTSAWWWTAPSWLLKTSSGISACQAPLRKPLSNASATPRTKFSGRCFTPSPSSSPRTCPSTRCRAWKANSSGRWPGRLLSLLLGALIFSMTIAPVLAGFLFRKGVKEWHNPVDGFLAGPLSHFAALGDRTPPYHSCAWRLCSLAGRGHSVIAVSSGRNFCRTSTKEPFGRAARLRPAPGPTEGTRIMDQARLVVCLLPRSQTGRFSGRAVPTTEPTRPASSTPNTLLICGRRISGGRCSIKIRKR